MLVSISGRKGSGKGVLAEILLKRGFIKVSWASFLKELVCQIYGWDLSCMDLLQYKEEPLNPPVIWGAQEARKLEQIAGISLGSLSDTVYKIPTRRVALQYIGTEVLRKYDYDFHVKNLIKRLDPAKNYVMDDTRFKNELDTLKKEKALCLYVVRPSHFDFSNHESEIAITRLDFEHTLLNDKSLEALIKSGEHFFGTYLSKKEPKVTKQFLLNTLDSTLNTASNAQALGWTRDKLVWWARKHLLRLEDRTYTYDDNAFSLPTPEAAYWAGYLSADGCIKKSGRSSSSFCLELSSKDLCVVHAFRDFLKTNKPVFTRVGTTYSDTSVIHSLCIHGSLLIDDLKLWNLRPRKGVYNELPQVVIKNEDCLKAWYSGLLDGDGSIYWRKQGGFVVSFLGSFEVLSFLSDWCKIPHSTIQVEKNVEGLYRIQFFGEYAKQLIDFINPGLRGLQRKWLKYKAAPQPSFDPETFLGFNNVMYTTTKEK